MAPPSGGRGHDLKRGRDVLVKFMPLPCNLAAWPHGRWFWSRCERALSGIHRSIFCDAMLRPRNREIPKSPPSRSSRNCRNWPRMIAEVELGPTLAMRQATWRTILTLSAAKYKGSRVACRFVKVVPSHANTMVTYLPALNFAPNQLIKRRHIADFFCEWYFAS